MTTIKEAITTAATDALITDALGKKWYVSKTVWINLVAAAALIAQYKYGFIIDPASQALSLSVINLILRKLTGEPIILI
jgi:hypothetical protein